MAIEPVTREERFLAAAGGRSVTPPTPITRKEQLLQGIIDAVKSGGAPPDVIEGAVNDYLNANPVQPGATTEQAAQIEQNKNDIADLQTEVDELKESGGNGSGQDVNPVTKTEDMTQPVGMDENGRLWTSHTTSGGSGGGGISATSINLLIDILKAGMFTTNVSGKIDALKEALLAGSSGDSGGSGEDSGGNTGGGETVTDDVTVSDGIMTIVSVGSAVTVSNGIMSIA